MPASPSQRSVVIARQTPAASSDLGQIADTLSGFFGRQVPRLKKEEIAKQRKSDDVALAKLSVDILSDPARAREASRTGDLRPFMNIENARSAYTVGKSMDMIGKSLGTRDADEFREAALALDPAEDSNDFFGKFIKEKTKGMSPRGALAYTEEVQKSATKVNSERVKSRADAIQTTMLTRAENITRSGLIDGELNNSNDLEKMHRTVAASMAGTTYAEALLKVREQSDRTLIKMATEGDSPSAVRAQRLLLEEDSTGTTPRQRMDKDFDKIVNSHIKRSTSIWNRRANDALADANTRLTAHIAGKPVEGDSLGKIMRDFVSEFTKFGPTTNAKFQSQLRSIATQMEGDADDMALYRGFLADPKPRGRSDKQIKGMVKTAIRLGDNKTAIDIQTIHGTIPEEKQKLADGIRQGDLQSVVIAQSMASRGTRGLSQYIGDDEPTQAIFLMLQGVKEPDEARKMVEALNERIKSADGKVFGAFERLLNIDEALTDGSERAILGSRGRRDFVVEQYEDLSEDQRQQLGLGPMEDFGDLSPEVQLRILRTLDVAALSVSDQADPKGEKTWAKLMTLLKDDYEVLPDGKGGMRATFRRSPTVVKDPLGKALIGRKWDEKSAERSALYFEQFPTLKDEMSFGGMKPDAQTEQDGSAHLTYDTGFGEKKFVLGASSAGQLTRVPGAMFAVGDDTGKKPALLEGAFEVVGKPGEDGSVTIRVDRPGPGESRIRALDLNTFLQWNVKLDGWEMRYRDVPDLNVEEGGLMEKFFKAFADIGVKVTKENIVNSIQELPADQREAVLIQMGNADPRFMTDEELRRRAFSKSTNEIAREIARRRAGGTKLRLEDAIAALPGQGERLAPGEEPEPEENELEQRETAFANEMNEAVKRGSITARAARNAENTEGSTVDKMNVAIEEALKDGSFLEDLDSPAGTKFMFEFQDFIEGMEGFSGTVYDDYQPRAGVWHKIGNKRGDPTVGFGFNLDRSDADAVLKAAGVPRRMDLLQGKETLTRDQATALLQETTSRLASWMRTHFKGTPIEKHRWVALMSLAYNSRWNKNGPTLIGPKLTKAIKEGRWEDARKEIEFNSEGGVPKSLLKGIRARRRHESARFMGLSHFKELE